MNILENEFLLIESKNLGAEITRIFSKKYNKEILWCGDSKFWGRHSPILFPIVGRLKDNETFIDNRLCTMSQHGFARDMQFAVSSVQNNSITYTLYSNNTTQEIYPYSFQLDIKYILEESSLKIEWEVTNTDTKEIYFSIGAHPAFNLNFDNSSLLSDYYIEFKNRGNVSKVSLHGPYVTSTTSIVPIDKLDLNSDLFINDALIFTNIDAISLKSKNSKEYIDVDFNNFPLVGIWTPYYKDTNSTAPFLCIEPWFGLADDINSDKVFENKKYINNLAINNSFSTSYSISIK